MPAVAQFRPFDQQDLIGRGVIADRPNRKGIVWIVVSEKTPASCPGWRRSLYRL